MRKGFTLLEVIITLLIISGAVLGIFGAFNKGQALTQHNTLMRQAIDLANSHLEVESFNGATTTVENPYPELTVNKTVNRHGAVSEVEVKVTWSDALNKNSEVVLTRNYYKKVN